MRAGLAIALLGGLVSSACASSNATAPAWFQERAAVHDGSYPSLASVPHGTIANTSAQHWSEVQTQLEQARTELQSNPRAQPSTEPEDPNGFVAQAQQELEQARQAHDDAPH